MVVDTLSAKVVDKKRDKKKADFFMGLYKGWLPDGTQSWGVISMDFYSTVTGMVTSLG